MNILTTTTKRREALDIAIALRAAGQPCRILEATNVFTRPGAQTPGVCTEFRIVAR